MGTWSIRTMINLALVNSDLICFLLVNSDLTTGQFGPREKKVRTDQGSSGVNVRIDQRSSGVKVRIDLGLNAVKVRTDQSLNPVSAATNIYWGRR